LADVPQGLLPVAICDTDFHSRWPWSVKRWAFVMERMAALTSIRWQASAARLAAKQAPQIIVNAPEPETTIRRWWMD
jgi:deoxyribodipyrimidine photo-lyase